MKTNSIIAVVLLLATVGIIRAQTEAPAQKNLKQFIGKWEGKNTTIEMDGQTLHTDYHAEFKAAANGTGLSMHEWFTAEGLGDYVGENIVGYDPNTSQIHWYSIDNTGTCHDHFGYWISPTHLFIQYQGVVEGKVFAEQLDMEFSTANDMHLKLTGMVNGKVTQRIDGTFKKMQ